MPPAVIVTLRGADDIDFGGLDVGPFAGPVNIYGNLTINTGQGGDELGFGNSGTYVGRDVDIQMGQGSDSLFLGLDEDNLSTGPDSTVSISLGQQ